jgi:oligosaccharide reducing-end xylanase
LAKKQPGDVSKKIDDAFQQLFVDGDATEIIYFEQADEGAVIYDFLHGNIRTEGMGLGMLIAVELDKQDVFDRLWRFSTNPKKRIQVDSGPAKGYFKSYCGEGTKGETGTACYDVYGMQMFALALIFAHDRWGSTSTLPYASDALALLDALQNKELENGGLMEVTDEDGVVENVGSAFDPTTHLVREEPTGAAAGYHRSSLEMPAAYELWAQATGNAFWNDAADAARRHLVASADAATGLWPLRSYFDGSPVPDPPAPAFTGQAYRTQLNLAMDALWGTPAPEQTTVADRVLGFFGSQGSALDQYGASFTLDGTPIDPKPEQALISVNGALVVAASPAADRTSFVNTVWAQAIPSGDTRYYDGLLYLMSLLVLSGQLRVY